MQFYGDDYLKIWYVVSLPLVLLEYLFRQCFE